MSYDKNVDKHDMMTPKPVLVGEITGIFSFLTTIDWSERWLWALGIFHLLSLLLVIVTRRAQNLQAVIFIIFLSIIFFSEYINELAAKNWRLFAQQQYFDSQGLFISILLSAPLLINSGVIVIMWMSYTWNLMITVKRKQLRHQAAAAAAATKADTVEPSKTSKKDQ